MLQGGVLCNSASLVRKDGGAWGIVGDPTEAAILTAAAKGGVLKETEEKGYPAVEELPFDSERKKMTIIRQDGSRYRGLRQGRPRHPARRLHGHR